MHSLLALQQGGYQSCFGDSVLPLYLEGLPSAGVSQEVVKLYSGLPLLLVVEDVSTKSKLKILLSGKELKDII